jgi:hypothetical protein
MPFRVAYSVVWVLTEPNRAFIDSHILGTQTACFALGEGTINKVVDEILAGTKRMIGN